MNFFPLYVKNTSSNTLLLFFYLTIPVTHKINYFENLRVNQPLKVTFSRVVVAQSKEISRLMLMAFNFMQFSHEFCH